MSPRNKLSGYYDRIHKVRGAAMNPGDDQTTSSVRWNSPLYTTNMVKYTSTVSNKLLIEGGFSSNIERYNNLYPQGIEQPYGSAAWLAGAHGTPISTSNATFDGRRRRRVPASIRTATTLQASASYITGTHSIKFGFQDSWGVVQPHLPRERRPVPELPERRRHPR